MQACLRCARRTTPRGHPWQWPGRRARRGDEGHADGLPTTSLTDSLAHWATWRLEEVGIRLSEVCQFTDFELYKAIFCKMDRRHCYAATDRALAQCPQDLCKTSLDWMGAPGFRDQKPEEEEPEWQPVMKSLGSLLIPWATWRLEEVGIGLSEARAGPE